LLGIVASSSIGLSTRPYRVMHSELNWQNLHPTFHDLGDATLAVRQIGNGPDVLFVHGVPTHGYTWRHLAAALAPEFRCWLVDLPGFGDARWTDRTDFRFVAQAQRLAALVDRLGLDRFAVVAHDTGATIARLLALNLGARVTGLTIINTEIPGHRPPWIRMFQATGALPGAALGFQLLLKARWLRHSGMGFGGCLMDPAALDGEFHTAYVEPLLRDRRRMQGMINYLRGIQWDVVDGMATNHGKIAAPVLALWGENDPTFPVDVAERMRPQFRELVGFHRIANARLLPHEDQPDEVLKHLRPFLRQVCGEQRRSAAA
jgi:pimeloyl-ACP methyl ester carboxylesterase